MDRDFVYSGESNGLNQISYFRALSLEIRKTASKEVPSTVMIV